MNFTPFEIEEMMENMTILVDTREQDTAALRRRLKDMPCGKERTALKYGDYSVKTCLPDGREYSLSNRYVIERKMSLDELCACFGRERKRFIKEFERAKQDHATIILLTENGDWEKAFGGQYRSLYHPASLVASLCAWIVKYGMIPQFCTPEMSGQLIYKLLRYALKESLEAGIPDEYAG